MKNIRLIDLNTSDIELIAKSKTDPIAALLLAKRFAVRGNGDEAIAILEDALSLDSLNYALFAHNIAVWMIDGIGFEVDSVGGSNLLHSAKRFASQNNLAIVSDILLDIAYYLDTNRIPPTNGLSRKEDFISTAIFANTGNPFWMTIHIVLRKIGIIEFSIPASLRFYENYKQTQLKQEIAK